MRRSVARPLVLLLAVLLVVGMPPVAHAAIDMAPVLTSPVDGSTVASDATLSWEPVEGATGYRVQVNDEPDFGFRPASIDTVATRADMDLYLLPGVTYWRVAALEGDTLGPWATGTFTVARTDIPIPISPANGANFDYPGPAPLLEWDPSLVGPYRSRVGRPVGPRPVPLVRTALHDPPGATGRDLDLAGQAARPQRRHALVAGTNLHGHVARRRPGDRRAGRRREHRVPGPRLGADPRSRQL